MAALRNYYNYRRLTKPATSKPIRGDIPAGIYDTASHIASPPDPEGILLRTARAERALYLNPETRGYEAYVNRAAISANNVGVKCFSYDLPRAFRNFRDAVELAPNFALAHNNLGLAYIEIGDLDMALHYLDQSIATDEGLDIAFTNRGLAKLELGDYQNAHDDFVAAIRIDPHDPMHYNNLGVLWLDAGQPKQAVSCFQTAIELDSQHPMPWRNLGYAYRELDDHEQAGQCFDTASDLEAS